MPSRDGLGMVPLPDKIRHVGERSAGEENLIDAPLLHDALIIVRDSTATAAENFNAVSTALLQLPNDFGKELDVTAIITGDADCSDILLNSRADNIPRVTMEAQVDDFDSVPDKFQVNGVNGAVVAIADRDGGENANRCSHFFVAALLERRKLKEPAVICRRYSRNVSGNRLTGNAILAYQQAC